MEHIELITSGGPILVAVILISKMYFDSKSYQKLHTEYDREFQRLEMALTKVEDRQAKAYEAFMHSLQRFTSSVDKLSSRLDLHANTLLNINGNLEKMAERMSKLEHR